MVDHHSNVVATRESGALPHAATLGAVTALAGTFVLIRWAFDVDLFNRLVGNGVLMMPWTAVGFVLLGASIWLLARASRQPAGGPAYARRLGIAFALLAVLVSVITQIELLTDWNPGFDLLLFRDAVLTHSRMAPGRMTPIIVTVQPLLGLSLVMTVSRAKSLAAGPALVVVVVGLTGLTGHLYDAETLFGVAGYPTVSLLVAILLMIAGIGALALQPDQPVLAPFMSRRGGGAIGRRLLPAIAALPMVLGWIRLQLEFAGWFGSRVGLVLGTCANVIGFTVLIWWTARLLNRLEAEREAIEHRAITSLEASERRYRTLAESLPQMIWTCRPDGWCDYFNPQWLAYTGSSEAQAFGHQWAERVHPDDLSTVVAQWRWTVKHGVPFDVEFRIRRYDGEYRWFKTLALPVRDHSGQITKWFGSNTDIDDRKRAEADLQRLTSELERRVEERTAELTSAKEQAESADRLKTDFITTMSHELRTPLNSIIGFTGTLLSGMPGPLNAAQQQQLRIVQTSGRNLLLLINDVLDVARIEGGGVEYANEPVDVLELIRQVEAEQAPLATSKWLTLDTTSHLESLVLMTDARALRQILTNLVNNGIKFTHRGSITITVSRTVVRDEPRFEIAVCDTGIGVAPEHLGRLFMKFSRLHEAVQSVAGGTGLGLYLSHLIASRLGMTIEVDSTVGTGSCFTVCVPATRAQRASQ